jgi:hypothetical protein
MSISVAQSLAEESFRFASLNPTFYQVLPLGAPPATPLWREMGEKDCRDDTFFSSPRQHVITNLRFGNLDNNSFVDWQRRTYSLLNAEGGPWFFRAAEIHLSGFRAGEKFHRKRLIQLLPLVFAAGPLYFRPGKYPLRWIRHVKSIMRYLPVESILLAIIGIAFVYLVHLPIQGIYRVWYLLTRKTETPSKIMTKYKARV